MRHNHNKIAVIEPPQPPRQGSETEKIIFRWNNFQIIVVAFSFPHSVLLQYVELYSSPVLASKSPYIQLSYIKPYSTARLTVSSRWKLYRSSTLLPTASVVPWLAAAPRVALGARQTALGTAILLLLGSTVKPSKLALHTSVYTACTMLLLLLCLWSLAAQCQKNL